MRAARFALVLLLGACALAAVPAADPVEDAFQALRKARTKEERVGALKGKDDDFLRQLIYRISDAAIEILHIWDQRSNPLDLDLNDGTAET